MRTTSYCTGALGAVNSTTTDTDVLLSALQTMTLLAQQANELEQAYIQALVDRYTADASKQSSPSLAFANTMRDVMQRYPDDLDAATLFAKALMEAIPWDYWDENGKLKPQEAEVIETLESVMQRSPNHPGANHFYIHAVEREHPELGVAAADRIASLIPGSGHFVHMPSHIYRGGAARCRSSHRSRADLSRRFSYSSGERLGITRLSTKPECSGKNQPGSSSANAL